MLIGAVEEIYKALTHNGEIEFDYKDKSYAIQQICEENRSYLTLWEYNHKDDGVCIARKESFAEFTEKEIVDKILNAKCIDDKSFLGIILRILLLYAIIITFYGNMYYNKCNMGRV